MSDLTPTKSVCCTRAATIHSRAAPRSNGRQRPIAEPGAKTPRRIGAEASILAGCQQRNDGGSCHESEATGFVSFERSRTLANLALVPRRGPQKALIFQVVSRRCGRIWPLCQLKGIFGVARTICRR